MCAKLNFFSFVVVQFSKIRRFPLSRSALLVYHFVLSLSTPFFKFFKTFFAVFPRLEAFGSISLALPFVNIFFHLFPKTALCTNYSPLFPTSPWTFGTMHKVSCLCLCKSPFPKNREAKPRHREQEQKSHCKAFFRLRNDFLIFMDLQKRTEQLLCRRAGGRRIAASVRRLFF